MIYLYVEDCVRQLQPAINYLRPVVERIKAIKIPQYVSNAPVPPQSRCTRIMFIALYFLSRSPIPCLIISSGLIAHAHADWKEGQYYSRSRGPRRAVKIFATLYLAIFFLILPTQRDQLFRFLTTEVKA